MSYNACKKKSKKEGAENNDEEKNNWKENKKEKKIGFNQFLFYFQPYFLFNFLIFNLSARNPHGFNLRMNCGVNK